MCHMVGRFEHVGLVFCQVRLGQTHLLACATWLGIGADMVRHSRDGEKAEFFFKNQLGCFFLFYCFFGGF